MYQFRFFRKGARWQRIDEDEVRSAIEDEYHQHDTAWDVMIDALENGSVIVVQEGEIRMLDE